MKIIKYAIRKSDGSILQITKFSKSTDSLFNGAVAAKRKIKFLKLTGAKVECHCITPIIESWTIQCKTTDGDILTFDNVPESVSEKINEAIKIENPVTW